MRTQTTNLRKELKKGSNKIAHAARDFRKELKKGKHKIANAKHNILKTASNAKQQFTEIEEEVVKYAKHNPLKTMGISVLAGVVIAQILHLHK